MDNTNTYYVYVLFRPWDGTPCYVGKGKGYRWTYHAKIGEKHPNQHLSRIFKKAVALDLDVPKIRVREHLSEIEAFETEVALIKAIGRSKYHGPLANMTDGGEGTAGLDDIAVAKIKTSKLGKPRSPDTIEKMRASLAGKPSPNRGIKHTTISRANMSTAHIGLPNSNKGKKFSQEVRDNMSVAHIGKRPTQETRNKMSESQKRRWIIRMRGSAHQLQ